MFTFIKTYEHTPALLRIVLLSALASLLVAFNAEAAGKRAKSAEAAAPSCPAQSFGPPVRPVLVRDVAGKAFPIPAGTVIDLSADIRAMVITALTGTPNLTPADQSEESDHDNCFAPTIELRTAVTTIELNLQEYGLTIGYTPTGTHSAISSAQGDLKVKVGTIAMEFSLWRCSYGHCTAVAAASANQNTVDTGLTFTVNFGLITSGASFASHPSFNKILRKIVASGMEQLSKSPRIAELPWSATIREIVPGSGLILIDAGAEERLTVNQKLVVYSPVEAAGSCSVFKALAYARIERVDPISSIAVIEQTLDSREAAVGDLVMLKP